MSGNSEVLVHDTLGQRQLPKDFCLNTVYHLYHYAKTGSLHHILNKPHFRL